MQNATNWQMWPPARPFECLRVSGPTQKPTTGDSLYRKGYTTSLRRWIPARRLERRKNKGSALRE